MNDRFKQVLIPYLWEGIYLYYFIKSKNMSEENKPIVALLGDIGGTNIRYELVVVNTGKN